MPSKLVTIFDSDQNFWELNPQFKIALSFKELYKKDKSRGRKDSSALMWFIAYCYDIGSTFYNLPLEEKHKVIGEDYLSNINFYKSNESSLEPLIKDYIEVSTTRIDRHLLEWDERLEDRTRFLATTKYDLDNFDRLDKMSANTIAVFKNLDSIKESLAKEASGGDTKGGFKESLSDNNEI